MDKRASYIANLTEKLKQWSVEIEQLKGRVQKIPTAGKMKLQEEIALLYRKQNRVQAKLSQLEDSAKVAWESLRKGTDRVRDELKEAVQLAAKKINPSTLRISVRGPLRIDTGGVVSHPRPKGRTLNTVERIK